MYHHYHNTWSLMNSILNANHFKIGPISPLIGVTLGQTQLKRSSNYFFIPILSPSSALKPTNWLNTQFYISFSQNYSKPCSFSLPLPLPKTNRIPVFQVAAGSQMTHNGYDGEVAISFPAGADRYSHVLCVRKQGNLLPATTENSCLPC